MGAIAVPLTHVWAADPATSLAICVLAGIPGALGFLLTARAVRLDEVRYLATALRKGR
jgi:uncharacterized membrane protein